MPRFSDEEKEYDGQLIKERPGKGGDRDRDEVAVYGSDDDNVVTGDEMDQDGNYDPNQQNGNLNPEGGEDDGLDNVQFDDEEGDDLGDFDDDEMDDGELDDEMSDGELEDGDEMTDELDDELSDGEESKEVLFDKLQDVLQSIVNFSGGDENVEDMSDEELGESFSRFFLREDAYLKDIMNDLAESSEYNPTDIYKMVRAMSSAEASHGPDLDISEINESDAFRIVVTKFKEDVKVINIIERVDQEDVKAAKTDAENANENWVKFKKNYKTSLNDPEQPLGGDHPKDEELQYIEDLQRQQFVVSGKRLLEYANESKKNPKVYVFAVETLQGESFVPKTHLTEEDAKSISNKTRKTKDPKVADLPFLGDKMLAAMLDVQFKGKAKPFAQIHKDLKAADQKAGYSGGQAKTRRGDKRSNGQKTAAKVEAAKALFNLIAEMDNRQVSALLKAFVGNTSPSKIVKESASLDLESDFHALREAAQAEGLSEDFINDTRIILETAVKTRVDEAGRSLEVFYNNKLRNEVDKVQNNVVEQLNSYMDYVAENFMEENKLAIEEGLRTEIAESLLDGIHRLFKEHNVKVPEGKTNLLESKNNEVEKLQQKVETEFKRGMAYKTKAVKWMKEAIIARQQKGLTLKEANELARRAEAISEFKNEHDFEAKVKDIKRLYFSENTKFINKTEIQEGTLLETVDNTSSNHGTLMDSYVRASKAMSQNY